MTAQAPPPMTAQDLGRLALPVLVFFVATLVTVALVSTADTVMLTPTPLLGTGWPVAIALGLALLCFPILLGMTPRSARTVGRALLLSAITALMTWMCASLAQERIRENALFRHAAWARADLPLRSAAITHGRGVHYEATPRDFAPYTLNLDPADYAAAFGKADYARASDYCVRVTLQRSGGAVRVWLRGTLPPGSLVRCPPFPPHG